MSSNTPAIAIPASPDIAASMLAALKQQADPLLATASITTTEQVEAVNAIAHSFAGASKYVASERAKSTELRRLATKWDRPWKAIDDLCKAAVNKAKALILAKQRADELAQRQLLEAAVETGAGPAEIKAAVAAAAPPPQGFVTVEYWTWERTGEPIDPSYLILDTARLDREARAMKQRLSVTGIRPIRQDKAQIR